MDITALNVQYEDVQGNAAAAPEVTVTDSSPVESEARGLGRDSPDDAAPVVPSEEPIQAFGYLQKQGRRLKGWHQRWFEIRGQHMYYYKTNAKKHCLGEIQLSNCTQVGPTSLASFGHPFELTTKERSHVLAARTIEDMEKWIDAIKKNMGSRPGSQPKKINKVKKWDSFKNAFVITRHRSVSPQRSNPLPDATASLPANTKQSVEVNRNKSFLDKFKRIKRDRSHSPAEGGSREAELRREDKEAARPYSEDFSKNQDKLVPGLVDPPTAVSVPNSPLTRKRQEIISSSKAREERSSLSPAPHVSQTPSSGGGSSGAPSPDRTPPRRSQTPEKPLVAAPSPPRHTSTPIINEPTATSKVEEEKTVTVFAKPRPLVPPTRPQGKKQSTPGPSPLAHPATERAVPEILTQHLLWEDVRTVLESLEPSQPLFPSETLPSQDEPWMERDTPIEQLREFLAVCS